jgi:3'-phosphoadenosine 5'-phosphosulfate sulfotransferase (PAPS reductase)/FAD synthetase
MTKPGIIHLPDEVRELPLVVSISGGKDSSAVALALQELELSFRMVFADTGWEAKETYAHLDYLRKKLGPIDVVEAPGGMKQKIEERAGFPARLQRWCTEELKLRPLRAYHDRLEIELKEETCSVVGVRAEESEARMKMPILEDEPRTKGHWGGWIWRPILDWTVEQVIDIHNRHGLAMNPLYHRGHDRVGCYPCIFSRKEEVRLIAEHAPERIAEIRELEALVIRERAERNAKTPGRYSYAEGTFFQGRGEADGLGLMRIDNVVEWSKTSRGGRQMPLFAPVPSGGCMRWGMCESPPTQNQEREGTEKSP